MYWPFIKKSGCIAAMLLGVALSCLPVRSDANPTAGKRIYMNGCARCHGEDGTGGGLAGGSTASRIVDLTTISRRNNGVFPTEYVTSTIDGSDRYPAHLNDMPTWGKKFENYLEQGPGDAKAEAQAWISFLVDYLRSIQR